MYDTVHPPPTPSRYPPNQRTYKDTYVHTYLYTYIPTYIPAYLHTEYIGCTNLYRYIHTYVRICAVVWFPHYIFIYLVHNPKDTSTDA